MAVESGSRKAPSHCRCDAASLPSTAATARPVVRHSGSPVDCQAMTSLVVTRVAQLIFPVAAGLTLLPQVPAPLALAAGIAWALLLPNPYSKQARSFQTWLLQGSVVGLGAAMNLQQVMRAGSAGLVSTLVGITTTLLLGALLCRLLRISKGAGLMISVGTAICGGSAIAAVSGVLRAKEEDTSVALGIVFLLNSLALLIFPPLGHALQLNDVQFGQWAALAIHDTSSVVGAALSFGGSALQTATTIKLARALWIIPIALVIGFLESRAQGSSLQSRGKLKFPWFILGFLIAAAVFTYVPQLHAVGAILAAIARRGLVLTLFLIGANLSRATLKTVGFRPLLLGVLLWVISASSSLAWVRLGM